MRPSVAPAAALAMAILAPMLLAQPRGHGDAERTLTHDGRTRTYLVHDFARETPAPVVIVLHGGGGNAGNAVRMTGFDRVAAREGFLAVYPNGTAGRSRGRLLTWNAGHCCAAAMANRVDDVGFIAAMIDDVARSNAIDRRRVYVAGFSSGGAMAHRLGIELAGRIAAISASAGGLPPTYGRPSRGMPILISAGDRDPVTPVEGNGTFIVDSHRAIIDKWRALNDCPASRRMPSAPDLLIELSAPCRDGSEVRYVRMLGVEHIWPRTDQIDLTVASWEFFMRFRLPN